MFTVLGEWKYDVARSPGLVEFLEKLGFPEELCSEETAGDIKISIRNVGGTYDYAMKLPGRPPIVSNYTPGRPFEVTSPAGVPLLATVKVEGRKVIETMINIPNDMFLTTVREVTGDEMKTVCTLGKTYTLYLIKTLSYSRIQCEAED